MPGAASSARLAGAEFLGRPAVRRVFAAVGRDGDAVRIVGGAVRNALLGVAVADVDFATDALPDAVIARAEAAGFKVVKTGYEHGTVTLVAEGAGYEVTTLREDVETDGRRAVVRFGRDWSEDARRRDFTINAIYCDADGALFDPTGGEADLARRRIRFIGEAERRIAEDRLRILRFFRFNAAYGEGAPDAAGLGAAIRARDGLRDLSAERIGQEMRKLVVARRAAAVAAEMQDAGILPIVLGGVGYPAALGRLAAFLAAAGAGPSPALGLAALGCRIAEDAERIAARMRLSNEERRTMLGAIAAAEAIRAAAADRVVARTARRILYEHQAAFRDGVALASAWSSGPADAEAWRELYALPERSPPPRFPLGGRDALRLGATPGPAIGTLVAALEAWWIGEDFRPDEAALRARLQQMLAAQQ